MRTLFRRVLASLGIALSAVACEPEQPAAAPNGGSSQALIFRTQGAATQLVFAGSRLFGPEIEVEQQPSELRGRAWGYPVFLQTLPGKIVGSMLEIRVQTQAGIGLEFRGRCGQRLCDFAMDEARITGSQGRCGFDLARSSASPLLYTGRVACHTVPFRLELSFPNDWREKTAEQRASAVALVMLGWPALSH